MNAPQDQSVSPPTNLRLAEVIGAFSLATDLGIGQPLEYALCSCILSVRIGEALKLNDEQLREVYYQALLRYIGCTAETHLLSSLTGDEIATRAAFATVDNGNPAQIVNWLIKSIRQGNAGAGTLQMAQQIARGILTMPALKNSFNDHCEVAQRLAERLGFEGPIRHALGQLYERWDGKGSPRGLKGENVALSVRVVTLAQDAVVFSRLENIDAAVSVANERSGAAYDPRISECFCANAQQLMLGLDDEPYWDSVLSLEPGPHRFLSEANFDQACRAFADFIDIKSPYTLNHSTQVAQLAGDASKNYGLPASEIQTIERAGLIHDLGKVGVGSGIWDKSGPLTPREWEKVRLHPYYTERILDHPEPLSQLGKLAGMHHERLDNSGYHRGAPAAMQTPAHRILAAASAYQAMLEPRAHRPALQPYQAADELRKEIRAGKLDSDAANCVLEAAGHHKTPRRETVAGLSERQVEVLRLLARGNSMKQIATALSVSPKTVDNHIQHIYNKIGVSTRAGATLFAMEQNLLAV